MAARVVFTAPMKTDRKTGKAMRGLLQSRLAELCPKLRPRVTLRPSPRRALVITFYHKEELSRQELYRRSLHWMKRGCNDVRMSLYDIQVKVYAR